MILLVGNYPHDRQQSMQRFAEMLRAGLSEGGRRVEMIKPEPFFGRLKPSGQGLGKWLGYLDKYLLFPVVLHLRIARLQRQEAVVVHLCDHSNATYCTYRLTAPTLATCHDLLAVRGALGEATDCPASSTGRILQQWILCGLRSAHTVAAVSRATQQDLRRLLPPEVGDRVQVVSNGLNYPYCALAPDEAARRLAGLPVPIRAPFVLHVGSNLRRKNRDGVLRIFAKFLEAAPDWPGRLVFAGHALDDELLALARQLGVESRLYQVVNVANEILEALYSLAYALLFPSRFEGFGWPIIEAQACGCPVLCSAHAPFPEVAGTGALFRPVDAEADFAGDLLSLRETSFRNALIQRGRANAALFTAERMIARYQQLYQQLDPHA